MNKQEIDPRVTQRRIGYILITIPFLCSQSLICSLMRLLGLEEAIVLSIQVAGSILFSTFSVLLTKDFNIFRKWFIAHRPIKNAIVSVLTLNLRFACFLYMILMKSLFAVAKDQRGCDAVDATIESFVKDFNDGPDVLKVVIFAIVIAGESALVIGITNYFNHALAKSLCEIIAFISSLISLVVILSSIKEFVSLDEGANHPE